VKLFSDSYKKVHETDLKEEKRPNKEEEKTLRVKKGGEKKKISHLAPGTTVGSLSTKVRRASVEVVWGMP
jgi:hypothetical protein